MSTPIDTPAEAALTALAERFEHWRRTRTNEHERIPEDLWDQAVALSTVLLGRSSYRCQYERKTQRFILFCQTATSRPRIGRRVVSKASNALVRPI